MQIGRNGRRNRGTRSAVQVEPNPTERQWFFFRMFHAKGAKAAKTRMDEILMISLRGLCARVRRLGGLQAGFLQPAPNNGEIGQNVGSELARDSANCRKRACSRSERVRIAYQQASHTDHPMTPTPARRAFALYAWFPVYGFWAPS